MTSEFKHIKQLRFVQDLLGSEDYRIKESN